ncbi:MAG: PEP-CTERM sorting domain-containing protein [Verrucomicrobia bacterium]|nr:PEP-CTERM sorting domain-containing protein [Verrucomicrobiota bacterium]
MNAKKTTLILAAALRGSMASAQLFWNPPDSSTTYSGTGGDGAWNTTAENTVWWDATTEGNVVFSNDAGAVFEGAGAVTNTQDILPGPTTFQNLTGDYTFSNRVRFNANRHLTVDASGGTHNVSFNSGIAIGGGNIITNNSSGLLSVGNLRRIFGSPSVTFAGSGNITANQFDNVGDGNMGFTMNGTGRLTFTGTVLSNETGNITLNAGEFYASSGSSTVSNDLVWNEGLLIFDLSTIDNSSNTININNAFTKGSGETFAFDFGNSGLINETYTLMTFASTDFALSDFTAVNTMGGNFSFGTTEINEATFQTLQYAVIPEPGTLVLLGIALGSLLLFRRRK